LLAGVAIEGRRREHAVAEDNGFEDFYRGTRQRVVTFLYAICGERTEAQDAAQEAFVRAGQRWSRISTYDNPEAWVRTVGYRLCLNRWRKAKNRIVACRRHGADSAVGPPSENTVALVTALKKLPLAEREAITLHHLLDLSVADVAAQTGAPVNTIKTRLVRGRRTLASLLGRDISGEHTHA
jgi:RNA polymerase sigma-70 factor (ECF subfamily)